MQQCLERIRPEPQKPKCFSNYVFFRVCLIVVQTKCGNTSSCRADFFRTKKKATREAGEVAFLSNFLFCCVHIFLDWLKWKLLQASRTYNKFELIQKKSREQFFAAAAAAACFVASRTRRVADGRRTQIHSTAVDRHRRTFEIEINFSWKVRLTHPLDNKCGVEWGGDSHIANLQIFLLAVFLAKSFQRSWWCARREKRVFFAQCERLRKPTTTRRSLPGSSAAESK